MKNPLIDSFIFLFDRELDKLDGEIRLYKDEKNIWKTGVDIKNAGGNLCLHLCGNLQHYIGATLGNSGYQRNRPHEFAAKGISQARLLEEIQRTKKVISETLRNLNDTLLQKLYPEEVLGYPMTTVFFLNHLFGHLGYHLGQINYHRRLLDV